MNKIYKVSSKGLPKDMKRYIPKKVDCGAMFLLVAFTPKFKITTEKFKGFDTLSSTTIRCDLKFQLDKSNTYYLIGVDERLIDMYSYETIWRRFYPSYQDYEYATTK